MIILLKIKNGTYNSIKTYLIELYRIILDWIQYFYILLICKIKKYNHIIQYVNPNDIANTVSRDDPTLRGNSVWHFGSTEGGNWDLNGYPVREYGNLYRIFEHRIKNAIEYEDIPEFREQLEMIENGGSWYGCETKGEYIRHWQRMETLYFSIMENGYKTQQELCSKKKFDEIRIQIGRKGELLFEEGFHRLVVAQLLNLEKIPVIVFRRHEAWANLREHVKRIVLKLGFIHQPFNHPDIDILPQYYGNHLKDQAFYGNERWGYILNSLPVKQGTVLDIGAYFGYFCHRFEDLGFECYAVEFDRNDFQILKEYNDIMKNKFIVWEKNLYRAGNECFSPFSEDKKQSR
ncbi:MAG: hypothetical protein HY881_11450 [Deltaproteobacteria bacterium]|nr:hypothetical protein [Deltaproteobacteria bacterium]